MEKIVRQGLLFDTYGELLTKHQRKIYQDAVYGDLSLSELADTYGITRQGAHDLLKRCDKALEGYEEKLNIIKKSQDISELAQRAVGIIDKMAGVQETEKESLKRILNEIEGVL